MQIQFRMPSFQGPFLSEATFLSSAFPYYDPNQDFTSSLANAHF